QFNESDLTPRYSVDKFNLFYRVPIPRRNFRTRQKEVGVFLRGHAKSLVEHSLSLTLNNRENIRSSLQLILSPDLMFLNIFLQTEFLPHAKFPSSWSHALSTFEDYLFNTFAINYYRCLFIADSAPGMLNSNQNLMSFPRITCLQSDILNKGELREICQQISIPH
ncbi:hypothetical protein L9F63_022879, partial [Diploptera punctata]